MRATKSKIKLKVEINKIMQVLYVEKKAHKLN